MNMQETIYTAQQRGQLPKLYLAVDGLLTLLAHRCHTRSPCSGWRVWTPQKCLKWCWVHVFRNLNHLEIFCKSLQPQMVKSLCEKAPRRTSYSLSYITSQEE